VVDEYLCLFSIVAADRESGRLVYSRNGTTTLGGLWIIKDLRRIVKIGICQSGAFIAHHVFYHLFDLVFAVSVSTK
jgi:hypothetical protein